MKVKIRQYNISIATLNDVPGLIKLAETLFHSTPYSSRSKIDYRKAKETFEGIITGDRNENIIICLYKDDDLIGALAGCVFHPLWNNDKLAAELFFCCKSKGGILHLINAYENWARSIGCKAMQFGIDHSKRRVFKGFMATEQMYHKELI